MRSRAATLLRWHRELIAQKWTFQRKTSGRPSISPEVAALIVKFAKENSGPGNDRIQGMLANLGHEVSDTTVENILKQHGIEPAPTCTKQTTWADFLRSHVQTMAACDLFTTEVWTAGGLVTVLRGVRHRYLHRSRDRWDHRFSQFSVYETATTDS